VAKAGLVDEPEDDGEEVERRGIGGNAALREEASFPCVGDGGNSV
jgi:hypothetical protein